MNVSKTRFGHTLVEETSSRLSDDVMSDMLVDSLE